MSKSVRSRRFRLGAASVGAVAAAGAAVLAFAAPAAAAASITVSPSSGLKDGQTVSVSISGFAPNASNINIVECLTSGTGASDCDVNDGKLFQKTDANGALTVSMTVRATFNSVDCTKAQCMIAAHAGTDPTSGTNAEANISFGGSSGGSSSAPAPAPTSTASSAPGGGSTATGGGTNGNAASVPTGADTGRAVTGGSLPLIAEVLAGLAVLLGGVSLTLHRRRTG
jgi:hypothetical protein